MGRIERKPLDISNLGPVTAEIVSQLAKESDRGIALISTAYMDDLLQVMIRGAMVDDKEAVDKLLGPNGAASGFAARINLAYLMGLISPNLRHDLNIMRDIRNAFAHYHQKVTFKDEDVADRCRSLRCKPFWKSKHIRERWAKMSANPKDGFILVTAQITSVMYLQIGKLKHPEPMT
jgi:DNA-binding MltR family transcriptional regulator